jgi:hypothetical protein
MNLFKPKYKVIKVRHEKRTTTISERSYGSTILENKTRTKTIESNVTVVLLIRNHELVTKEFEGKWGIEDIRIIE